MDDQIRQVKTGRELSSLDHVPNPAVPLPPQLATFVSSIVTHKYNWVVGYTVEPLYTTPNGNIPEAPELGTPHYNGQNVGPQRCPL